LALHPSETEERLMARLLAFALCVPVDDRQGPLEFAKGLSDADEPDLWQRDLTGRLVQWIEVGQPDERRLLRAAGRADRVSVFAYGTSTPIWWQGLATRVARAANLAVWQIPATESRALAALAVRSMQLQIASQSLSRRQSTTGSAQFSQTQPAQSSELAAAAQLLRSSHSRW